MNAACEVRPAGIDDAARIVAFQLAMAWETEQLALDESRVTLGVRAVLEDPSKGRYLVAVAGSEVVGGLLLTYEWSDWRNGRIVWIQSVYVDPAHRRRGVFRQLFTHVLNDVQASPDFVGVRLYVERGNRTAQSTYRRLGMNGDHYEVYEWYPPRR